MHEMSLAENLLQILEASAETQNFRRVRGIVLEIGQLSAVEPEAMPAWLAWLKEGCACAATQRQFTLE